MKKLISVIFLLSITLVLWVNNALAVNCVAVAFHNSKMAPPNDIIVGKTTNWSDLSLLASTFKVILLRNLYENPKGNPVATGYQGDEQYGLTFQTATQLTGDRKGILVSYYNLSPEKGERDAWLESKDPTDPVQLTKEIAPTNDKEAFMRSNDVNLFGVSTADPAAFAALLDRARALPQMQAGTCGP